MIERKRERGRGRERRAAAGKSEVTVRWQREGETRRERYIRNLILISPQFNYSADKSCTCTA